MRAMNDANSQMYVDLLSLLEGYFDVRLWSPDSKRVFSMKSFYGVLTGDNVSLLNESYLWRIPRVLAFYWIARLQRPLIVDMLQWNHHTWLMVVCFVSKMQRMFVIFLSIVVILLRCGILFFVDLGRNAPSYS